MLCYIFFHLCDVLLSPGTEPFRYNHILIVTTVHDKVQRQWFVRACQSMLGQVVLPQLTSHMLAELNLEFVVRNVDRRTCLTPALPAVVCLHWEVGE